MSDTITTPDTPIPPTPAIPDLDAMEPSAIMYLMDVLTVALMAYVMRGQNEDAKVAVGKLAVVRQHVSALLRALHLAEAQAANQPPPGTVLQ